MLRIKRIRIATWLAIVIVGITVSLSLPSKAQAGTCGYAGTDYAGAVITLYWNDNGTFRRTSTPQVSVTTTSDTSTRAGNLVSFDGVVPSSSNEQHRVMSATFNQISGLSGTGCPGAPDNYGVILGYDTSSGAGTSTDTTNNAKGWVLDCDESLHPGFNQGFEVTGVGVPVGALPGGTWEKKIINAVNGQIRSVTLLYTPPTQQLPKNAQPVGYLDQADCKLIAGWAKDPDDETQAITVHIYFDGPAGSGAYGIAITAGDFRSDVANHAFNISIDDSRIDKSRVNLRDNGTHLIYAYGLDLTDGANNAQLTDSPRQLGPCPTAGPNFNVTPSITSSAGPSGSIVTVGTSYTVTPEAVNSGADTGTPIELNVSAPIEATESPPTQGNANSFGRDSGCGTTTSLCGADHFWWIKNQLTTVSPDDRIDSGASFNFTPNNVADGTQICFTAYAKPKDSGGASAASAPLCYTIANPRYPVLTTSRGDVHAGGGIGFGVNCDANPLDPKFIHGSPRQSTNVSFVASAGGSIDSTIASPVSFGDSPRGNYGQVCRPDLAGFAESYYASHPNNPPTIVTAAPSSGDLKGNSGQDTFIYANGNVTLDQVGGSGQVVPGGIQGRVTLFVRGSVTIKGNISYNSGVAAPDNLPAFGLIATGSISIENNVGQLDGYYFADGRTGATAPAGSDGSGRIDTCSNINISNNANACNRRLTVNGLMMAKSFRFARTGDGGCTSGCVAISELINFVGDLYLSAPPVYRDVVSPRAIRPQYGGDLPPLY